jgi:hypothetical protein
MKHEIRWSPELEEWFCVTCGRVSDHLVRQDAQGEMDLFECELPFNASNPDSKDEMPFNSFRFWLVVVSLTLLTVVLVLLAVSSGHLK